MTDTRTDRQASAKATQVSITDLVKSLRELLGPRLMSLTIGVDDKTVTRLDERRNQTLPTA